MPIAVVAQPANTPPRFQITITSPAGQTITAATLYRTSGGVTTAVRVQPAPGPSPLVVFDYEAPWETGVIYSSAIAWSGGSENASASPVTLAPTLPWAIHPTTPALSLILDQGSFDKMGVVSIGAVSRPALTTKHRILGSEFQVVTKTGPRAAPTLTLQLATVTAAERAALDALLRDQTPLFIQTPDALGWDFDDGYYDVSDYTSERQEQYAGNARRIASLTLERVEAPAGTQQAIRTYTTVLGAFATYSAVAAAYATYTDLLTDSRR